MKIGRLATCTYVHQRARGEKPINGARLEVVCYEEKSSKSIRNNAICAFIHYNFCYKSRITALDQK
jgi:hypothetical protein